MNREPSLEGGWSGQRHETRLAGRRVGRREASGERGRAVLRQREQRGVDAGRRGDGTPAAEVFSSGTPFTRWGAAATDMIIIITKSSIEHRRRR